MGDAGQTPLCQTAPQDVSRAAWHGRCPGRAGGLQPPPLSASPCWGIFPSTLCQPKPGADTVLPPFLLFTRSLLLPRCLTSSLLLLFLRALPGSHFLFSALIPLPSTHCCSLERGREIFLFGICHRSSSARKQTLSLLVFLSFKHLS